MRAAKVLYKDEEAGVLTQHDDGSMELMLSKSTSVEKMIAASFLNESTKKNYWQSYQGRMVQLMKV